MRSMWMALGLLASGAAGFCAAQSGPLPNVVIILADDIGYGDLGCYGAKQVQTPNLDRLAAQGVRFTDAHSPAAVCTPTRYSLLTGQYAFRHKPGAGILSGVAPLCIPLDRPTLPKMMQAAGYRTGVVGKWHLGLGAKTPDYNTELKPGAKEVGFDYSFLIPATGDRTPCVYVENGRVVGLEANDPILVDYKQKVGTDPTGLENPERLTNQRPSHGHNNTIVNGISRIGWMSGGQKARWRDEDMADTITGKATKFIAESKEKPFFLYFATHDVHVPRVPHERFRGQSKHGLRGDCIQEFDWSVGQILKALDERRVAANTLVIVTSDNGGVMDDGYMDGTQDDKSGHRCNGSLRGFKGGLFEGGHRVPFLVRWPGKSPAGVVSHELICHVDLFAALAALVGQKLRPGAAPDSLDISPALLAAKPAQPCRTTLVHQGGYIGGLALRAGEWKLIPAARSTPRNPSPPGAQLFQLTSDPAESTNLARENPEKVIELNKLLEKLTSADATR